MDVGPPLFQVFLDEQREPVYRFLVAAVGPTDADDCFQETFLSALRAYPRLRRNSDLRAWILTIAHRKAMDMHRSRRRRVVAVADPPERGAIASGDGEPALWTAVRALPDKQRAAIVCRFVSDLTYRDIGVAIGCSEEAARQNVRAGLQRLREVWS